MTYSNPVVRGTAPDPSAIRVGNDYYLATSTFDQLPGVTIRHSLDLVNWRIVGHAITRPAQYRRDGQPGPIVLFAPTLRHHDGTFYLACTNAIPGEGNFYVTTTNITGEWSDAVWVDDQSFDPSLFRDDDGTWYYTRRNLQFRPDGYLGPIVQATIDIATGELGELREITGPHGFASNDIEGPHLYKVGDWYYLCSAEGGSWQGHMQTVARSRSPWGPFEAGPQNPFLTHRHLVANRIQTIGHAELVEAADGTWWALSLGTRHPRMAQHHNLGRETFLTPVTWVGGWPVAGARGDGTTDLEVAAQQPDPAPGCRQLDVQDTLWNRGWKTIGAAPEGLDPTCPDSAIGLPCSADPLEYKAGVLGGTCGALIRPQFEDDQSFTAIVAELADGVVAGIAAFADTSHYYALTCEKAADGSLVVALTKRIDDLMTRTELSAAPGSVQLVVDGHETHYTFAFRQGEAERVVGRGSARLISAETAQWFVGVHWMLLASGPHGRSVRFEDCAVTALGPTAPASPVPF